MCNNTLEKKAEGKELIRTLYEMAKRGTAKAVRDELLPLQVGGRDLRRSQFQHYLAG